jgi:hypothetical protein
MSQAAPWRCPTCRAELGREKGVITPKLVPLSQPHRAARAVLVTPPGLASKELAPMHSQDITASDCERFWAKVDTSAGINGCWRRACAHTRDGYAKFYAHRQHIKGSRFAFLSVLGDPPPDLPVVRHRCPDGSHRWCNNPAHLTPGTHLQNAMDREEEGRTARGDRNAARLYPETRARGDQNGARLHPERRAWGERNGSRTHPERLARGEANSNAKLTMAEARIIRQDLAAGISISALARRYGVSRPTIKSIREHRTWREEPVTCQLALPLGDALDAGNP